MVKNLTCESFCVAHALLQPGKCVEIFWKILDYYYHGSKVRENRIKTYYETAARGKENKLVHIKMNEVDKYKKELSNLGIDLKLPEDCPPAATAELQKLAGISCKKGPLEQA